MLEDYLDAPLYSTHANDLTGPSDEAEQSGIDGIECNAWSDDSRFLAVASTHRLAIWDVRDLCWKASRKLKNYDDCVAVAFQPGSTRLAIHTEGEFVLWDFASGESTTLSEEGIGEGPFRMAFSPTGRYLAVGMEHPTGGYAYVVSVWDMQTRQPQVTILDAIAVAFSVDQKQLITSRFRKHAVCFIDTSSWQQTRQFGDGVQEPDMTGCRAIAPLPQSEMPPTRIELSSDGRLVWLGCQQEESRMYDTATEHDLLKTQADAKLSSIPTRWDEQERDAPNMIWTRLLGFVSDTNQLVARFGRRVGDDDEYELGFLDTGSGSLAVRCRFVIDSKFQISDDECSDGITKALSPDGRLILAHRADNRYSLILIHLDPEHQPVGD